MNDNLYKKAGGTILSQRELEAQALVHMAAKINAIKENWDEKKDTLEDVLNMNRKLWIIFASNLAEPDNPLPLDLKKNVGALALFIFKHTLNVISEPRPEALDTLININMQLAKGLATKVPDADADTEAKETQAPVAPQNMKPMDISL